MFRALDRCRPFRRKHCVIYFLNLTIKYSYLPEILQITCQQKSLSLSLNMKTNVANPAGRAIFIWRSWKYNYSKKINKLTSKYFRNMIEVKCWVRGDRFCEWLLVEPQEMRLIAAAKPQHGQTSAPNTPNHCRLFSNNFWWIFFISTSVCPGLFFFFFKKIVISITNIYCCLRWARFVFSF